MWIANFKVEKKKGIKKFKRMQDINMKTLIFIVICALNLPLFVLTDTAVNPAHPRQCYSCEGINCQRITRQNMTTSCTDLLDICVTIFEDFSVVAKGCYLDMPEAHRNKCDGQHNPECLKCFGQLCNNKGRDDFKCIECNDSSKCAQDTTDMAPVQCPIPTAPNSYCYVRQIEGGRTQRGCFVHVQDQLNCLNDVSCSMCLSNDGAACNSYKVNPKDESSRGTHIAISAPLLLTLFLLTRSLLR